MFVRSLAIIGAAAAFAALHASAAYAFFGHDRRGGYKTCYKKVTTPPVYRTVMTRVMVRPATCSSYRTPPTYGTVAQEVVVQPSHQVVHSTPPVYGRVEETRMVRPERTRWTRDRCGDLKCAVTKPAKYRTRTRRVMLQPRQNWVETRPAVKELVHRQVMLSAGEVKQVCEPAVYETVPRQVMVSPGTEHWVPVQTGHAVSYQQPQYAPQPVQYSAPRPHYAPQPHYQQYPHYQPPLK